MEMRLNVNHATSDYNHTDWEAGIGRLTDWLLWQVLPNLQNSAYLYFLPNTQKIGVFDEADEVPAGWEIICGQDIRHWFGVATREPVSYTHLRAHETVLELVCRLLLEKKQR